MQESIRASPPPLMTELNDENTPSTTRQCFSTDLRIPLILLMEKHSLLLSCLFTVVLVALTMVAVIKEFNSSCDENLKLWLLGTATRALLASSVVAYAEGVNRHLIRYNGNPQIFHKIIEMLDVFGVVWFCIGNLLVFNESSCQSQTPLVFYVSLTYIVFIYFLVLSNLLLRVSLAISPASVDLRMLMNSIQDNEFNSSQQIDWKAWLESFDCREMTYAEWKRRATEPKHYSVSSNQPQSRSIFHYFRQVRSLPSVDDNSGSSDARLDLNTAETTSFQTCPICLDDFIDCSDSTRVPALLSDGLDTINPLSPPMSTSDADDVESNRNTQECLVVSFPCTAKHLFHAHCLKNWLSVLGSNRLQTVSCPVCRQSLTTNQARPFIRTDMRTDSNA